MKRLHAKEIEVNLRTIASTSRFFLSAMSVLVACVVSTAASATLTSPEVVHFETSPRGHILVSVSINGSDPLRFVLDTAAAKTFVTPGAAEKLRLAPVPVQGVSTQGVHGKTVNPLVEIQSLNVGMARATSIQAVVLDLDHITRGAWQTDGVLGMDFLTQFDVILDYAQSTVSFFPAAAQRSECAACPAGTDGIAFETINPGFIVLPATIDGSTVRALLDTGSGHSGLNSMAAAAMGVTLPPMPTGAPAGHGFGLETGPLVIGDTILAERTTLRVMDHPVMDKLGLAEQPSMLMGTDQLAGQVLTICYGLQTLFLQ